jgi:hypothetical protein
LAKKRISKYIVLDRGWLCYTAVKINFTLVSL